MRDDMTDQAGRYAGPLDLPDEIDQADVAGGSDASAGPSLMDELSALVEDGKTYAEAELAFQKSRAGYVASAAKNVAALGLGALAFLHLALIALVVGLVITLTPMLGALGATAVVVAGLLVGAGWLALKLRRHINAIGDAFSEPRS